MAADKRHDSSGIALSAVGGLISLVVGLLFPLLFPEFGYAINLVFQVIFVTGGIITIIGALIAGKDPATGRTVVFVGGLLGGVNIISLYGAGRIYQNYTRPQQIQRPMTTAEQAAMAMGEVVENPLPPESTIWWIDDQHSRAKVEGRPVPSWEDLSLQYRKEFGAGPSASQMERLFATWQKIHGKKVDFV